MVKTLVGYAGGTTADPTYEHIGDHSEVVEIEFDPGRISYRDLLAVFWSSHDPSARSITRQYRTAVLYEGEEQRRLAEDSRDEEARRRPRGVATAVEPLGRFTTAEDYHQKYYLRSVKEISEAFHRIYPDEREFAASTAVARVNGYLAGHGGPDRLAGEIESLGLEGGARRLLEEKVRQLHPRESCSLPAAP